MRVVIADDAELFRGPCRQALVSLGVEVVAEAASKGELIAQVRRHHPHAVLVDICLQGASSHPRDIDGIEAAEQLHEEHPFLGILILSSYMSPSYLARVLKISDHHIGYLGKDHIGNFDAVADALVRVAAGGTAIDAELWRNLLRHRGARRQLDDLTPRKRQTLELLARGLSNKAIAREMSITENAVEDYISKVFTTLNIPGTSDINKRVWAVLAWLRGTGSLPEL